MEPLNDVNIDLLQLITSIAAVFIAVAAFFITIWQSWMTRKHNYNSVKPLLSYERHFIRSDGGFGIYLRNNGLGPAIIVDWKLFIDGREIKKTNSNPWAHASKYLNIDNKFVHAGYYDKDTVIAVGERNSLLAVEGKIKTEQEEHFRKAIQRIGIEIYYKSIYGLKDMAELEAIK